MMYRALKLVYFKENNALLAQGDVTGNVSEEFPPTYITDGNTVTFDDQAIRLDEKLNQMGIYHVLNFYRTDEEIPHGYESDLSNPYALDNLEKMLSFMDTVCQDNFS